MPATVTGCRLRLNRVLPVEPITSFECSVEGSIDSYYDVELVAREALEYLAAAGLRAKASWKPQWELIGRKFNLYTYTLGFSAGSGALRVVEASGEPVAVAGVVPVNALPGALRRALAESDYVVGDTVEAPVLLEPLGSTAPGQHAVPRFVAYAVEGVQRIEPGKWILKLELPGREKSYTYGQLLERTVVLGEFDFHCVTGWSVEEVEWEGVLLGELLEENGLSKGEGLWLGARSTGGYTSIAPLEHAWNGFLVLSVNGRPLSRENGFPVRLFYPSLYGWKSVKWLESLVVLEGYEDGYWEALGYHERGLVVAEERFKVRNPAIARRRRLLGAPRRLPPAPRHS